MLNKILNLLDKKQKIEIFFALSLLIFTSFLEIIGIGLIPILLSFFLDSSFIFNKFDELNFLKILIQNLSEKEVILILCISIVSIFLFKNIMLGLTKYYQSKILKDITQKNAEYLYNNYLNQPFKFFLTANPNILARNIVIENQALKQIILMTLLVLREIFILVGIILILITYNWKITFIILIFVNLISITYILLFRNKLSHMGKASQDIRGFQLTNINQAFGAIKDIIISKKENFIFDIFKRSNEIYEKYNMIKDVISQIPRLLLETSAVLLICVFFGFISTLEIDKNEFLVLLSLIVISTIRIIPSYNLITSNLNRIQFIKPSLNVISEEMKKYKASSIKIKSNEQNIVNEGFIILNNLSFCYDKCSSNSINNFSEKIKFGSILGITGPSGSGKSTLINLISGLLKPTSGYIRINELDLQNIKSSWFDLIGYVGQDIFLIDDTIKKNIAFGIDENLIDDKKINSVLEKSCLIDTINNLDKKIDTKVGERGIRISGGQKQRIGIARALYKNPKILIFDEATSSLDYDLEKKIIDNIIKNKDPNTTIIFVAHRITTLKDCDKILYMENAHLKEVFSSYNELIEFKQNKNN